MRSLNNPRRALVHALLIAFWALSSVLAPAHAANRVHSNSCEHGQIAADVGGASDFGHALHVAHGCGGCHFHVLGGTTPPVLSAKSGARQNAPVIDDNALGRLLGGVFRPPRA